MKRLSLTGRITVLVGIAAVLVVGAAALTMDHLVDAEMGRRMDADLLTQAQALQSLVGVGPKGLNVDVAARAPHHRLLAGKALDFWAVTCANGGHVDSQPPVPRTPPQWNVTARSEPAYANVRAGHQLYRAVWFRFVRQGEAHAGSSRGGACSVLFMRPRGELDDILTTIDDILLLTPLLALLVVLLLTPVLVRRGLRPLVALGDAMRDIGPQAPGQRLRVPGAIELDPLVEHFNGVLVRMDESMARERQFAGALAHETRTHLAELRSLIEVEQRYPSGKPLSELLGEIGTIVGELQATVSGLLLLTRLEAGIESMDPGRVPLVELLDRQLELVQPTLAARRLTIVRDADESAAIVVADRTLLEIIVGNLVNNAAAYAPPGGEVGIRLTSRQLVIDNATRDLEAHEVEHFGQRFWSKHHGMGGHAGLGLALAGAAASAMHFELAFVLDAHMRLQATLSWPAVKGKE
ncbi:MAG TPA: ATP-binding protein [Rhodanobacteraceae bacterium]